MVFRGVGLAALALVLPLIGRADAPRAPQARRRCRSASTIATACAMAALERTRSRCAHLRHRRRSKSRSRWACSTRWCSCRSTCWTSSTARDRSDQPARARASAAPRRLDQRAAARDHLALVLQSRGVVHRATNGRRTRGRVRRLRPRADRRGSLPMPFASRRWRR